MKDTLEKYYNSSFLKLINRRTIFIFLLGFSSGLPLALCFGSLQVWFNDQGIQKSTVGLLAFISLPYTYKFLWAPIFDRFFPPFLGRRRGWILVFQLFLVLTIMGISFFTPGNHTTTIASLGVLLAFFSASQDIVFDAYRTDILKEDERGIGASLSIEGYRIAMMVSGAGSLFLAERIGWNNTYLVMSFLMLANVLFTLFAPEIDNIKYKPNNFFATFKDAFKDMLTRKNILFIILLVMFYKVGDALSQSMTTIFLLDKDALNLTKDQAATINKVVGVIATVIGMFFGGTLIAKLKLFRSLLLFWILQTFTNLFYVWIAIFKPGIEFVGTAVFIENLCGGMGTAAFVAFLMSLCNKKFTATQYAILSSLSLFGRSYLAPFAGYVVEYYGWVELYLISFFVALPALYFLFKLRKNIEIGHQKIDDSAEAVGA